MESVAVERAIEAIWAGRSVLLPADGVYGLCASPFDEAPTRRLYELKGRGEAQPTAIIAASVEKLFELVPELDDRARRTVCALLPGAFTLVLPNPARRFPWLNGNRPETVGVRVAEVPETTRRVLAAVGAVAATSANEPGEPPAASLAEVSGRIRAAVAAELDAGRLSGVASTVIDFTAAEPAVLREGASPSAGALLRVEQALAP
jgi:tRNA threonylcarbamoyl adenosine modification protein (Sua5/YciO/YrdC/YwlC family)